MFTFSAQFFEVKMTATEFVAEIFQMGNKSHDNEDWNKCSAFFSREREWRKKYKS